MLVAGSRGCCLFFPSCKNHGNLEASAECLVEEQPGLELRYEREPR